MLETKEKMDILNKYMEDKEGPHGSFRTENTITEILKPQ